MDLEGRLIDFRSGVRPPHDEMIRFIDIFKDRFGVEPNCVTRAGTERWFITTRGYRAANTRPNSANIIRDDLPINEIASIHAANWSVYEARKIQAAIRRAGW